jgi:FeS assembly SUF system regulator
MLRVTKFTDYALVVLSCLVTTKTNDSESYCILSAAAIAKSVNLQLPTVSKILKILVKSELVKSYRGSDGGYSLARDPSTITVNEVIASLEGRVSLTDCTRLAHGDSSDGSDCEHVTTCQLKRPWQKINIAVNNILNNISISDIAHNKIEI